MVFLGVTWDGVEPGVDLGHSLLLLALALEVLKLIHKHLLQIQTSFVLQPDFVLAQIDEVNPAELFSVGSELHVGQLLLLHELEVGVVVELVSEQVVVQFNVL